MRNIVALATTVSVITISAQVLAQDLTTEEQRLVDLINQERAGAGLGPLSPDLHLSAVARSHSQDMAQNRFFSHVSPTTGDMADRLRAAGVPFRSAAENIAVDETVDAAHAAFMASPHHRENLLGADYSRVGIGVIRMGERVVVTQAFMRPRNETSSEARVAQAGVGGRAQESPPGASAPADPAPASTLASPFDVIGLLTGASSGQEPGADVEASPATPPSGSSGPRATPPADPAPGLWLVGEDGTWRRVDLDPALLRLLSVL